MSKNGKSDWIASARIASAQIASARITEPEERRRNFFVSFSPSFPLWERHLALGLRLGLHPHVGQTKLQQKTNDSFPDHRKKTNYPEVILLKKSYP